MVQLVKTSWWVARMTDRLIVIFRWIVGIISWVVIGTTPPEWVEASMASPTAESQVRLFTIIIRGIITNVIRLNVVQFPNVIARIQSSCIWRSFLSWKSTRKKESSG
ncbi:hypothetical protein K7432_016747 [Basidiobolus ranarum]|uniref:Uncharacterized protein n=1 Tax=Basidiobolus ranarum TaxID=34480 RepID=A0ABR2VLI1_9FUNG